MAQERPQGTTGAAPQAGVQSPSKAPAENAAPDEASATLPGGTRLVLILTHPVDSRTTRRGDGIYTETTAPVTLDKRVVMPAGTFVQGKVEKLTRHGTRAEMVMRSVAIIFPDGYVTNIGGPMTIKAKKAQRGPIRAQARKPAWSPRPLLAWVSARRSVPPHTPRKRPTSLG
jgi:hypothetical protein